MNKSIIKISLILIIMMIPFIDAQAGWKQNLLNQDRCLELYRPQSKETASFCYWTKEQGLNRKGYAQANHILRDVKYKKTAPIDPKLLDTLFILQQWLIIEGRSGEIHILSGYRTPEHNASLKNSARNSLHMKGLAADIHIPGTTTKLLAAMSTVIGSGGVGIYIKNNFVHIDTGNVRMWKN